MPKEISKKDVTAQKKQGERSAELWITCADNTVRQIETYAISDILKALVVEPHVLTFETKNTRPIPKIDPNYETETIFVKRSGDGSAVTETKPFILKEMAEDNLIVIDKNKGEIRPHPHLTIEQITEFIENGVPLMRFMYRLASDADFEVLKKLKNQKRPEN